MKRSWADKMMGRWAVVAGQRTKVQLGARAWNQPKSDRGRTKAASSPSSTKARRGYRTGHRLLHPHPWHLTVHHLLRLNPSSFKVMYQPRRMVRGICLYAVSGMWLTSRPPPLTSGSSSRVSSSAISFSPRTVHVLSCPWFLSRRCSELPAGTSSCTARIPRIQRPRQSQQGVKRLAPVYLMDLSLPSHQALADPVHH